jgi:MYXO-CTERM domain-containing protein
MKTLATVVLSVAALAGMAQADVYTGGTGGALVDSLGNNNAAQAGTAAFTLLASNAANPTISSFNSLTITMGHSFAGDLVMTLTSPSGAVADIVVRPGVTTATGFGTGTNFGSSVSGTAPGTATYTFVQSGGTNLLPAPVSGVYAPGTYNILSAVNPAVVAPGASGLGYGAFNGLDVNGTWTLTVRDLAAGDTGSVVDWSMDITTVPTPGAAALLGLGGLVAGRRRRA